ncbi:MAG: hypothetical protein GY711_22650 [bacterium]|nr:hypothetical protein [bacterium]
MNAHTMLVGLGAGLGLATTLVLAAARGPGQDPPVGPTQGPPVDVKALFEKGGVLFDAQTKSCAIRSTVEVRDELLEYLLVLPHGAAHEAVFVADIDAEVLNTALLTLGATPGKNASWEPKEPEPTPEELRAGVSPYNIVPPTGDGFYLYAAWSEDGETYYYRIEDLIRDLERKRTLRRHRFVYLGSRMVTRRDGSEHFAAQLEGNLINVAYFPEGNTLMTGVPEECVNQTIWLPNAWLLPPRGSEVLFVFSRERRATLSEAFGPALPENSGPEEDGGPR